MKNYLLFISFMLLTSITFGQTINWRNLDTKQEHIISTNIGWDYGLGYGLSYAYQPSSKFPIILNSSLSAPFGEKLLDDFKTKIGAQLLLFKMDHFQIIGKVQAIYRRYESPLVRLQNFGTELGSSFGYYQSKWFVAGQLGFDKAILTHFKHSNSFRQYIYNDVKDGWYEPSSGGNFSYGVQIGYSFNRQDLTVGIGKTVNQDFKTTPLIPYYFELGYNFRIMAK